MLFEWLWLTKKKKKLMLLINKITKNKYIITVKLFTVYEVQTFTFYLKTKYINICPRALDYW